MRDGRFPFLYFYFLSPSKCHVNTLKLLVRSQMPSHGCSARIPCRNHEVTKGRKDQWRSLAPPSSPSPRQVELGGGRSWINISAPQNNQDSLFPALLEQCFLILPFTKSFLILCCNLSPLYIILSSTTGKSIPKLQEFFLCAALLPFISLKTTPSAPVCRHFLSLQSSHCCPLCSLHPSRVPKTGQILQQRVVRSLL